MRQTDTITVGLIDVNVLLWKSHCMGSLGGTMQPIEDKIYLLDRDAQKSPQIEISFLFKEVDFASTK